MSLDTPDASAVVAPAPRLGTSLRYAVAVVCAGSAGVHAALVPEHLHQSAAPGLAFAGSAAALAVAGVATRAPRHDAWAPALAAVVLLGTAVAYVLSRTTGIPGLLPDPETVDPLGVLTTAAEAGAAIAALLLSSRRDPS